METNVVTMIADYCRESNHVLVLNERSASQRSFIQSHVD